MSNQIWFCKTANCCGKTTLSRGRNLPQRLKFSQIIKKTLLKFTQIFTQRLKMAINSQNDFQSVIKRLMANEFCLKNII